MISIFWRNINNSFEFNFQGINNIKVLIEEGRVSGFTDIREIEPREKIKMALALEEKPVCLDGFNKLTNPEKNELFNNFKSVKKPAEVKKEPIQIQDPNEEYLYLGRDRIKAEILQYLKENGVSNIPYGCNKLSTTEKKESLDYFLKKFNTTVNGLKKSLFELIKEEKIDKIKKENSVYYKLAKNCKTSSPPEIIKKNNCERCGGELEILDSRSQGITSMEDTFEFQHCIKCGQDYY